MDFIKNIHKHTLGILLSLITGFSSIWAAVTPMKATQESPQKVTVSTANYCRGIITALNQDKIEDALKLLNSFYKKIPSTLKNSTRKKAKKCSFEEFKSLLINDSLNYHKSLFMCLAMCLSNATKQEEQKQDSTTLEENINLATKQEKYEISILVKTAKGKTYSIQFSIGLDANKDSVIVNMSISEIVISNIDPIDISAGYKTNNFFKKTTLALVPSTQDEIIAPVKMDSLDPKAAEKPTRDISANTNIKQRLEAIFNAIPKDYRVHLEQYAQFIIFGLVKFMGSCICDAEYITGDGRADLIIRTEQDDQLSGSIIELKRDKGGAKGLIQIDEREYINNFDEEVQIIGIGVYGLGEETVTVDCQVKKMSPRKTAIEQDKYGAPSVDITSFIHIPKKVEAQIKSEKAKKRKKRDREPGDEPAGKRQRHKQDEPEDE